MNAEEKYQAELKQSDLDHHQPTAAAMTGHIISNLLIHSLKINQAPGSLSASPVPSGAGGGASPQSWLSFWGR